MGVGAGQALAMGAFGQTYQPIAARLKQLAKPESVGTQTSCGRVNGDVSHFVIVRAWTYVVC